MKHMSKHTVVEHLVSHHSPQRTESPSIPIRVSLIWALLCSSLYLLIFFCARLLFCLEKKKKKTEKNRQYCSPRKDTVYAILFALFSCLVKISVAARLAAFSTPGVCCWFASDTSLNDMHSKNRTTERFSISLFSCYWGCIRRHPKISFKHFPVFGVQLKCLNFQTGREALFWGLTVFFFKV